MAPDRSAISVNSV
uniref:Uncharacterized protein n=1 Tax=Anguilla anguilla TaxID=7936 RepID=A0A0E9SL49_ANGAN